MTSESGPVAPQWLTMLRNLRDRDRRSDRDIAAACMLSHTTVSQLFNGLNASPRRETVEKISFELTSKINQRQRIMDLYDQDMATHDPEHVVRPRLIFDPRPDMIILADALGDVADALDEVARAIFTLHQSQAKPEQP